MRGCDNLQCSGYDHSALIDRQIELVKVSQTIRGDNHIAVQTAGRPVIHLTESWLSTEPAEILHFKIVKARIILYLQTWDAIGIVT